MCVEGVDKGDGWVLGCTLLLFLVGILFSKHIVDGGGGGGGGGEEGREGGSK